MSSCSGICWATFGSRDYRHLMRWMLGSSSTTAPEYRLWASLFWPRSSFSAASGSSYLTPSPGQPTHQTDWRGWWRQNRWRKFRKRSELHHAATGRFPSDIGMKCKCRSSIGSRESLQRCSRSTIRRLCWAVASKASLAWWFRTTSNFKYEHRVEGRRSAWPVSGLLWCDFERSCP